VMTTTPSPSQRDPDDLGQSGRSSGLTTAQADLLQWCVAGGLAHQLDERGPRERPLRRHAATTLAPVVVAVGAGVVAVLRHLQNDTPNVKRHPSAPRGEDPLAEELGGELRAHDLLSDHLTYRAFANDGVDPAHQVGNGHIAEDATEARLPG